MKKSIALVILVTLVIASIAVVPLFAKSQPGGARAVFQSNLFAPEPESFDLEKGEVWIREDGSFKVEVEGVTSEGEIVEDDTLPVQLLDLLLHGSYDLGDMDIIDGEGMIEGYLYDYGVPEGSITPIVVIDEAFLSGCYVPSAP